MDVKLQRLSLHCNHYDVPNIILSHDTMQAYSVCMDCHVKSMLVFDKEMGRYRFLDTSAEYAVIPSENRHKLIQALPVTPPADVEIKIHLQRFKI